MKYIQIKKSGIEDWQILQGLGGLPKMVDGDMTLQEVAQLIEYDYDFDVDQIRFWDGEIGVHSSVYTITKEATVTESIAHKEEEYEYVDSPTHYNTYEKEVIDMMVDIYGKEKVAIFCEINAFKYRMRMGTKPGQDVSRDLDKEKWYLDKKNELKG
jgi:hypothetical protein